MTTENAVIEAMGEPNGPGWELDAEGITFFLWAPRGATSERRGRENWKAAIQSDGGWSGTFAEGSFPASAMENARFPYHILKRFLEAIR